MLTRNEIERAVELQTKGYLLLQWLEKALEEGFIAPEAAHVYASMEDSAFAWIERHYLNLPVAARPAREDLVPFSRLFSTYLTNTFDLEADPGERLYSPDAHCFCPCCSWMVRVPHLKPKKLGAADKKAAESLKRAFLRKLAVDATVRSSERLLDELLGGKELREEVGLCTYAHDLLQRLQGVAVGPATLALWRSFAWTAQGSPKHGFKLSADAVMQAQDAILRRIRQSAENE
ncbi:MAG TPA: hypothetical protein VFQ35_25235 [Polyangiaceae bacterium]|nr:hypothetical protein [Polyangiaceae bacterium]